MILVAGILAMGLAPAWLTELIGPGSDLIVQQLEQAAR
jgi:NADH:ubiquinone oxidoreductase subunit 4 (subunit M)